MDSNHPGLREHMVAVYTVTNETDLFSVLPELYENLDGEDHVQAAVDRVQAAVDSLTNLNSVPDPMTIKPGTRLRYLVDHTNLHRLEVCDTQETPDLRTIVLRHYKTLEGERQIRLALDSWISMNDILDESNVKFKHLCYFKE